MGKARDLSPGKISEIKTLLVNTNHSHRKIASIASVSKSTVDRIKKKIDEGTNLSPKRVGKCGRKRITTPRAERQLRNIVINHRKASMKVISTKIRQAGINVSSMTARRRIKEMGFSCRRPAKKPFLTPTMMKKRLLWAKQHRNWTADDWKKVSCLPVTYFFCFLLVLLNRTSCKHVITQCYFIFRFAFRMSHQYTSLMTNLYL